MKILVFSDTHDNINECIDIVNKTDNVRCIIHAGDHAQDAEDLAYIFENIQIHYVSGNNDPFSRAPFEKLVTIEGKKIFITHGHTFNVRQTRERLALRAKEAGADIAVFGHTHQSCDEYVLGMHVFNPGSMGFYPRTYGVIKIENDEIHTEILRYKFEI